MFYENTTKLDITPEKIARSSDEVFYNEKMKHNRDVCIALLSVVKPESIALPLAGSGVRAIRICQELDINPQIFVNDINKSAISLIETNAALNGVSFEISHNSADVFLLSHRRKFAYIDIDPFGSPNPFLDASLKRIAHGGFLAVTATDTAPLCGTYPSTCLRKYHSVSSRITWKNELGLRILIKHCQQFGAQYDKALIPILSYSKDHYFRVYFRVSQRRSHVDAQIAQHKHIQYEKQHVTWKVSDTGLGPCYIGPLQDSDILKKVHKEYTKRFGESKWFDMLASEIDILGYYHMGDIGNMYKLQNTLQFEKLLEIMQEKGYTASRTVFFKESFRTNMPIEQIVALLQN